MSEILISILTPVYNRAYMIENLYISLLGQRNRNFEWIIVDDGSTDHLLDLVGKWKSDDRRFFRMEYIYQANGGKHRAWNKGIHYCQGKYTFVVDSDDYLTEDAIEKVIEWTGTIKDRCKFAGISGRKGKKTDGKLTPIGRFPDGKPFVDASNLKRHSKNLMGDMAEVYRTDLLRVYPFPEFEGEKFCSEGAVMNRIAKDGYLMRWFPDIIYVGDYLEDGLSKNVLSRKMSFFQGYTFVIRNGVKQEEFPYGLIEVGKWAYYAARKGYNKKECADLIDIHMIVLNFAILLAQMNEKRMQVKRIMQKRRNEKR